MMSKKKKQVQHYSFESNSINGRFIKICFDMMMSSAWKDLKMSQKALYLEFKKKFTRYSSGDNNQNDISLPKSEASQLYGDLRTFRSDLDVLIEHGFIKCIQSGYTNRTPSIYGFSDKWKQYGKPGFEIPIHDRRPKWSNKKLSLK